MNWYYMKRGCFRNRGVVSREQLDAMARNGSLSETDLLCSDDTHGKWVRANSITALFPPKEHQPIAPPALKMALPPQPNNPPPAKPAAERPRAIPFRTYFAVLCLALLAISALVITGVFRKEHPAAPQPPPPPPAIPEETNVWATVETDVAGLLQSGRIREADAVIRNYIAECGTNEISSRLLIKMNQKVKQERLKELYSIFRKNEASNDQLKSLIALSSELGETTNLVSTLRTAISAKTPPSQPTCQSILAIGRILQDHALQKSAVIAIGGSFTNWSSTADSFQMADLYTEYQMPDKAIELYRKFTELNPDESAAWLELSALLSVQKKEEECLAALKRAVQTGGDTAREKARKDPRFDFVKDSWTFKWQTR